MYEVSDGASEWSRKIFLAKIDRGQGPLMAPKNGRNFRKSDVCERQVEKERERERERERVLVFFANIKQR